MMILILSSRSVTTADQCLPPIRPTTSHRGSPTARAGTSMRMGSFPELLSLDDVDPVFLAVGLTLGTGVAPHVRQRHEAG